MKKFSKTLFLISIAFTVCSLQAQTLLKHEPDISETRTTQTEGSIVLRVFLPFWLWTTLTTKLDNTKYELFELHGSYTVKPPTLSRADPADTPTLILICAEEKARHAYLRMNALAVPENKVVMYTWIDSKTKKQYILQRTVPLNDYIGGLTMSKGKTYNLIDLQSLIRKIVKSESTQLTFQTESGQTSAWFTIPVMPNSMRQACNFK